ncbi:MAG: hypothetical protein PG977_000763 [Bartonella clarridgeiae]|nr:MAG: hypothetical protein PG977_000763 [Bartonella clarridgeiae]
MIGFTKSRLVRGGEVSLININPNSQVKGYECLKAKAVYQEIKEL